MAVFLGAMGSLAPKLLQLLQSEYTLQKNVEKKVKFLIEELDSIQAALNKVAAVPWDQLDNQVKVWACQVREASYDMEDVLDTFLVRVEGGEPVNHKRLKRAMKKVGDLFRKFKARRDISVAIDGIEKHLEEVANRRARYKIDKIVANLSPARTVDPRLSAFYTKSSQLVGIDEPRDKLIEMLSIREDDGPSNEMIIISIVGFGGLGKTTLAKSVYDKVAHQFDCAAFVPVGNNPDTCKVLRDLLIDLTNDVDKRKDNNVPDKPCSIFETSYTGADLLSLDQRQLINNLRRFLDGKRYFIVIDDIWDIATWEVLNVAFVDSNPRSRIIATTRKSDVAQEIGKVYGMKSLPENQSRQLLYTRIFGMEENWPDIDKLAVVSQNILHRCDGVPLAIITIGSLLARKQIEEWSNVYDSVGFGHEDDKQVNNMKKILSFSYYDLPCHLQTCMLYLSAFPEDHVMRREKLSWMWIAEGIVQTHEGKTPFEVADSYILELINRGMIQPVENFGYLTGFRVHDMVLHTIRDFSRKANFLLVNHSNQGRQENIVRRLALHKTGPTAVKDVCISQVRSFNAISCGTDTIPPVSGFQFLRVLNIESCRPLDGHLDTQHLGKLLHLRFVGLQDTPTRELPRDIGHLKFLQTLQLTGTGIEELPMSLAQHTKLMCLVADYKTRVPDWIGKLTSLVQLVIHSAVDHSKCFFKELGKLTDLRVLHTKIDLQDEDQAREFLQAMNNLQKLETAEFLTSKCSRRCINLQDEFACTHGIKQLSFELCCNNLNRLVLYALKFSRLPKWFNPQALPNLCTLALHFSVIHQQDIEILGMFKKLCSLHLNLTSFWSTFCISGGSGFQNLRNFIVQGATPRLEFVQGAMPRLEAITLTFCVIAMKDNNILGLDFGLGNISALQAVTAQFDCVSCLPREVEEVEADLRHAVSILPNRPTLEITRKREDQMLTSSDSVMERNKKRGRRLWLQIMYQKHVREAMLQEVVEMGDIKTDLNPSAKNKVQEFHQQFAATDQLVKQKLHQVQHGPHMCDRHPNRLLEDIKAMEQALDILNLQYPLLAALLDQLRYAFSLQGAMLVPQVLNLNARVYDIKVNMLGLNFGLLGKISSLRVIKAHVNCEFCFPTEVEEVEAELRQAIGILHPNNPPMLVIIRYAVDRMLNSNSYSEMLLERQIRRANKLRFLIGRLKNIHDSIREEVVKMGRIKTDFNPSDLKNKLQGFGQQFTVTVHQVKHKLLPVEDGTPVHNRDLKRVLEDIKVMEQALEILIIEYPRFASMLDQLRYAFSLQEAMPRPQILELNIRVFDIMVHKQGLNFGLLGKVSSLLIIKAHLFCDYCFPTEVEELEAKLRQVVDIHHPNNPPTLQIIRYAEDKMVTSDSDSLMLERQKWRWTRLMGRVQHQCDLHDILQTQVVKMIEQKTGMNLSDDVKHKDQRFHKHFHATRIRVQHELLRVNENIPNRDLKRMTEEIEDMERALQIMTVEYPRLVAMQEELKTALSLQAEDEVTQEVEVSEAALYDTEEEDEVPAALLSDIEDEDDVNVQEDKVTEEYKVTEEVVSAASVSETQGQEPINL